MRSLMVIQVRWWKGLLIREKRITHRMVELVREQKEEVT
jgi:hypothetical protein